MPRNKELAAIAYQRALKRYIKAHPAALPLAKEAVDAAERQVQKSNPQLTNIPLPNGIRRR